MHLEPKELPWALMLVMLAVLADAVLELENLAATVR